MPFEVGQRVGDYQVTGVLGEGGMGKVYQVRNVISNREEALKILLPDLASNNEVAERFLREIRVLASLDHPNIAQLRTAQRDGNQILMVMELIEGQTLEGLLFQGPVPVDWQLHIIIEVLTALEFAHKRGVVHRDIKPSNIMITPNGDVKLMDFGIAKLAADQSLTATGATPGSLYYMSPEQINGASDLDGRSDLYSLGVCLYQMVTGKRPFDAASQYSLMSAHLNLTPQEPIEFSPSVPPALNQMVMKALEKKAEQRFQSAGEMLAAAVALKRSLRPVGPAVTGIGSAARPPVSAPPMVAPVVAAPVVVPPMPPSPAARQAGSSRRGLYMAVGSVATVAVLGGALYLAPRFMHTAASTSTKQEAQQQSPVQTPLPGQPVVPNQEALATSTKADAPQPASRPDVVGRPGIGTAAVNVPPPQQQQQPQQPVQQQQQQVQQSPPPQQPSVQQPVSAPTQSRAELATAREEYNQLAVRSATVTSGLQSLQNQMNGMGLRADMREAAARMNYLMTEAMSSIQSGDAAGAKKNLDLADRTVEKLEKFLGH